MTKQRLSHKLVTFQQTILGLEESLREEKKSAEENQDKLFLEVCEVLDAFENIFSSIEEKEQTLDKTSQRMLKSFRSIYRKLIRLLEGRGVKQIEFPEGRTIVGLCRVIEIRSEVGREEGEIITIVHNGYQSERRVLQPAEVIAVGK